MVAGFLGPSGTEVSFARHTVTLRSSSSGKRQQRSVESHLRDEEARERYADRIASHASGPEPRSGANVCRPRANEKGAALASDVDVLMRVFKLWIGPSTELR